MAKRSVMRCLSEAICRSRSNTTAGVIQTLSKSMERDGVADACKGHGGFCSNDGVWIAEVGEKCFCISLVGERSYRSNGFIMKFIVRLWDIATTE